MLEGFDAFSVLAEETSLVGKWHCIGIFSSKHTPLGWSVP
jgi:hypothetical protein